MMLRAVDGPAYERLARGSLRPWLPRESRRIGRITSGLLTTIALLALPAVAWPGPTDEGIAAYEQGDYKEALQLIRSPAEQGDPTAQLYLGLLYLDGKGVAPDVQAAAAWFRKAAAQGHAAAQYNLAVAYYEGQGVTQSFVRAADWFRRAAKQNYGPAAHNLAAMYEDGSGIDRDPRQALHWYERAAQTGLAEAMHELAAVYFSGRLGSSDPVRAYMWLLLALQHGDEDAGPDRLDVERSLSPAQIRSAEALAASWKN